MATATFQHEYSIQAHVKKVYAHLAEPTNYIGLSPQLVSLADIEWGINLDRQRFVRYWSVEVFQFFRLIKYTNQLDVVMTLTVPNRQIVSEVHSGFDTRIVIEFNLQPHQNSTQVIEVISLHTPALLRSFFIRQARAVQQNRERVLRNRLAT